MKLETLYKKADKNSERFRKVAHTVIWDEVVSDEENKKVIAMFTARDMAIGEILTRNKYFGVGLVVGVAATLWTRMIWDRVEEQEAKEASEKVED